MYYPKALKEYTRKFVTDMVCACLLPYSSHSFCGCIALVSFSMVNQENNPYERIFGNYSPVCGNRIVFNVSGEKSVYWCLVAVKPPFIQSYA